MAFYFTGTSCYAQIATPVATTTPITISAWIKPASVTGAQTIVAISKASGGEYFSLQMNGTKLQAATRTTKDGIAESTATLAIGNWYHVCAIFSASNLRDAYVNGGNMGTNTSTNDPSVDTYTSIGVIGGKSVGYFTGQIAEVGIWNVALTTAGVANLYNGAEPTLIRPTGLISYVPLFHHSSGWNGITESGTIIDYKRAGGYTIYNAPTYQTHIRVIRRSGFDTPNMFPYQHSWGVSPRTCSILL